MRKFTGSICPHAQALISMFTCESEQTFEHDRQGQVVPEDRWPLGVDAVWFPETMPVHYAANQTFLDLRIDPEGSLYRIRHIWPSTNRHVRFTSILLIVADGLLQ